MRIAVWPMDQSYEHIIIGKIYINCRVLGYTLWVSAPGLGGIRRRAAEGTRLDPIPQHKRREGGLACGSRRGRVGSEQGEEDYPCCWRDGEEGGG